GNGQGEVNILLPPLKEGMRLNIHGHQRVTRLRAAMAFAALTLEADLLAAVDAGRNGYVEHPSTIKSHTFCRAIRRLDKADGEAIGAVVAARPKDALACTSNTLEEFSKDMVVGFRFRRLRIRRSIACGRRFFLAII